MCNADIPLLSCPYCPKEACLYYTQNKCCHAVAMKKENPFPCRFFKETKPTPLTMNATQVKS
jgi:hypothetical protein